MDSLSIVIIIILTIVGMCCGIAIFIINRVLPEESEALKKTGEISEVLPGMNCGACGRPGCFAYAQALVNEPKTIEETPCMTALKDESCVAQLESLLGITLDTSSMDKKAVVHCTGRSDKLFDYQGISTCKGAAQLSAGYKICPFGCLGLGDCVDVCPYDAISIDPEKDVAVVDHEKCIGCGLCTNECPHGLIELVLGGTPQYLGCSYTSKKDIPGRQKCETGCIKCRKCVKATKETDRKVEWDKKRNLPIISVTPVPEAVEACPNQVIMSIEQENNY